MGFEKYEKKNRKQNYKSVTEGVRDRSMKLLIGIVTFFALADAGCDCDQTPTDCSNDCAHCDDLYDDFVRRCGKQYAKACKKKCLKQIPGATAACKNLGFKGDKGCVSEDEIECEQGFPTTCY